MEVIEVREDAGRPAGAVLRIDGYEYPVTVSSPFDTDQLQELDWYFEQHLRFPFTDRVRARQAGESITAYGEALFQQLIASAEAREAYGELKRRAYPDRLAIAGDRFAGFPGAALGGAEGSQAAASVRPRRADHAAPRCARAGT